MKNLNPFSTSEERITVLDATQTFSDRKAALKRLSDKKYDQGAILATIGALIGIGIGSYLNKKNNS